MLEVEFGGVAAGSWSGGAEKLLGAFFGPVNDVVDPGDGDAVAVSGIRGVEREEVDRAVSRIKKNKAPGLDGISGAMVKEAYRVIPEYFFALFSECVRAGKLPLSWRTAEVVVILKSDAKPRNDPKSYRPICLLPVFSKVMEGIMIARLDRDREGAPRATSQYGFICGRSTVDAWIELQRVVRETRKKYVLGIFIDFVGAFDNISWESIVGILGALNIGDLSLWKCYFSTRRVLLHGPTEVYERSVCRGCPQGSLAGPYVWNLVMNGLLLSLEEAGARVVAYADDLLILVEGGSRMSLECKAREWLGFVSDWCKNVGLEISISKSVCMMLRGKFSRGRPPTVRFGEQRLRYVTETKYVGITIGEGLNFLPHFRETKDKMLRLAGKMGRVLRSESRVSKTVLDVWWSGLFTAVALYGCPAWMGELRKVAIAAALDRCERAALYGCFPFCRTVSTAAMQTIGGYLPWRFKAIEVGLMYKIKRGIPTNGQLDIEIPNGTPWTEVKSLLHSNFLFRWDNEWAAAEAGQVTKLFIPSVILRQDMTWLFPSMHELFLLTGHGSLNSYLHRIGQAQSPLCPCGNGEETVLHIMFQCRLYDHLRPWDPGVLENGLQTLLRQDRYVAFAEFAKAVFRLRTEALGD